MKIIVKNIFFTGEKGVGKSTIIKKIIKNVDCSIGGFIQEKELSGGNKRFRVKSLYNLDDSYIIGFYDKKENELHWDINTFDIISRDVLLKSLQDRELMILDELGYMEEKAPLFQKIVFRMLDSSKPVIGVLKKCNGNFVRKIAERKDVQVIEIDKDNRDLMERKIRGIWRNGK